MPENQASAVPQGARQRRARPESEDVTDQPAATRIRVEEARQLMWTMRSTVEDILLEGSTNRNKMKLNEFIQSYLGEEWVVERNGNVAMEAFVQDPETFIKKKRLLSTIKALPSYQALEAINKLHHEGVFSLEQWRDYEGKDTLTPLARGNLNRVLTQVLREERLEAEERAVREEQVGFTLTTTIRDVLFRGRVRVMDMKLNDFLTLEMEGRGILRANRNVLLRVFISDPTSHIRDAGVLGEIQTTDAYLRMEGTVREEMGLEEVVRRLHDEGVVDFLEQWRDYEGKDTVTPLARRKLNRVLTQLLREEHREAEERAVRGHVGFTLTTTIRDVLFRGRVRVMDMKLNDFLMMELEGRGILRANQNVLLRVFISDPTSHIRDAGVLGEIQTTDAYLRMEGTVREEMGLEEVARSLCENGVFFLEQWRDYEGKDTVTPLARENLNRVLTQLLREERLEAEERAVREEQVGFTLTTTIRDVLFRGRVRVMDMKLNDFLMMELEGRGILRDNQNVLLRVFISDPTSHIRDAGVLGEIRATGAYLRMEGTVREEMGLEEVVRRLHDEGVVDFLEQWRDYEGKDTVTPLARRKLNRVLTQLLREEHREAEERAVREEHVGFTLTTTIRDVLFRGRVRVKDMKLNDFLMMELEGRGILRDNQNVLLRVFISDPTSHIRDAGVLGEIRATGAYLRMEGTVREEMGLEEVVRSLCENGVDFLEQWRDYEGKDTVTPLARRKLNRVLTQLLREEHREAEERAVRGHVGFTLTTTIRDVLFRGRVRVKDMKLNDFLMMELEGRGILRANQNVLLRVFISDPTSHIRDAGVLGEIQATDAYAEMERAVREEMGLEEEVRRLSENGVNSLAAWSLAAEVVKASVHGATKNSLNAALEEVRNPTTSSAPRYLEGLYESVYNASWHHVVEVPGGEGTVMEVKEGKPEQQWTYRAVGRTFEKDDCAQQSGAPRLRLMVLTSDKKWPYSWREALSINDCYVNCEVERVWQTVKKDISEFLSPDDEPGFVPGRRVLIGTPGIGKSMGAGSYLLYQLLHYDAEQLPMVAYFIADRTFLFDKTTQVASVYEGDESIFRIVSSFSGRGVKGYVIYDVTMKGKQPQIALPCEGWGMILLTSPNIKNFEWWASRRYAARIVINCPKESDVRAICAWMKHNRSPQEQAKYWKEVKEQMEKVGPILRFILNKKAYTERLSEGESAVNKITASKTEHYADIGELNASNDSEVSHKLVKVVRVRRDNIEWPLNVPISHHFEIKIFSKLESEMKRTDFIFLVLSIWDYVLPHLLEKCAVSAFLNEDFLRAIRLKIKELKLTGRPEPQECALLRYSNKKLTRKEELPENPSNRIAIEYWVLYRPTAKNFPLVDGFFFVDSNPKIMVGLQITTASEHHTIPSTVSLFKENMAEYFNGWEELSRDLSWEIVYIQHKDNKPLTGWQRCGPANPNNETDAEKEIAAFWKKKVHQYQVGVSAGDIKPTVPSVENDQQNTNTN